MKSNWNFCSFCFLWFGRTPRTSEKLLKAYTLFRIYCFSFKVKLQILSDISHFLHWTIYAGHIIDNAIDGTWFSLWTLFFDFRGIWLGAEMPRKKSRGDNNLNWRHIHFYGSCALRCAGLMSLQRIPMCVMLRREPSYALDNLWKRKFFWFMDIVLRNFQRKLIWKPLAIIIFNVFYLIFIYEFRYAIIGSIRFLFYFI